MTAYLPDFTMADGRYTDITVRMLLNHSSGLPGSTIANGFLLNDPDTLAADTPAGGAVQPDPQGRSGAFSVYCNDGFTLAELVVEAVSGMDFDDYVRQAILEPAGLEDTWFPGEDFDQSLLAKTYYGADETRALPPRPWSVHGTGGIYATASDLAAFGGAVLFCEDGFSARAPLPPPWPTSTPGHLAGGHRGCGLLRPGLGQRPLVPICLQRHSGRDQGATPFSTTPGWWSSPSMIWPRRCSLRRCQHTRDGGQPDAHRRPGRAGVAVDQTPLPPPSGRRCPPS